ASVQHCRVNLIVPEPDPRSMMKHRGGAGTGTVAEDRGRGWTRLMADQSRDELGDTMGPREQGEARRPTERLEVAWRAAMTGGTPPMFEAFLAEVPEPQRDALRSELDAIDRRYRGYLALTPSQLAGTIPGAPAESLSQAPLSAVLVETIAGEL